jgi:hypothetical protein
MISLEAIVVISLLLYLVQKISIFIISWIKSVYLINSLLFLINSYLDSGIMMKTELSDFSVNSMGKKLTIKCKDANIGEEIREKIEEILEEKKLKHKVIVKDNVIEIIKSE